MHKLYRHIGDEGQKKIKQWKLNLDEITPDQLFEHLNEECKLGGSAYRSRADLWHNTKQSNMTLDDFYNKIKRLWFVQFQPWGAQSISQGCLSVQFEQSRHYTMSDWAVVKRRCQSLKLQPPAYQELSKDYQAKQGNRTICPPMQTLVKMPQSTY